ncbi:hypothetical protein [Burkholderia pseudomultivorans]|uniref:Acyl-CoA dehydrogenase n=1 Tax=Burkholderia pseudomultivorans TaxID=1207504 RepID=A0A132EA52_9BURK|nr:hypothetical protein [Burkholderia pseudomultivorans]KWF21167.1 hypothetical protein WT56_29380 [Burkholderia pseudomultivorans]
MEVPLTYERITTCAEREIHHHLTEAATRPYGSHAVDRHLDAAIGIFDLWRCLVIELGIKQAEVGYMADAQRPEGLLRLASLSGLASSISKGDDETA